MVGAMQYRRRLLVAVAMGSVVPRVLVAQPVKLSRVGFLAARSRESAVEMAPFLEGMRELGYVEGRNVEYVWRFADGKYERLRPLADEMVRLKVDLIAASSTPGVRAAQQATQSIPIVMVSVVDPVRLGFVTSLARPGGNITGVSNFNEATWQKQFDLLVETVPSLSRIGLLFNPDEPFSDATYKNMLAAAKRHKRTLVPLHARTPEEIEGVFAVLKRDRVQGLLVAGGASYLQQRHQLAMLAAKARLPVAYYRREYVEAGGLMSYGRNASIGYRRAATYVDKILKGAKPADLPVEQVPVIELVINQTAARALGINFPGRVLVRADKILE